jgi:hypothetical protein
MLKPFTQADAKPFRKSRKGSHQLSLWSLKPIPTKVVRDNPLSDHPDAFKTISALWGVKGPRLSVEEAAVVQAQARGLAVAIEARLGAYYVVTLSNRIQK